MNVKKRQIEPVISKKTDVEILGLSGPVRQCMQTRYKAHQSAGTIIKGKIERGNTFDNSNCVISFNEKGAKAQEHLYGKDGYDLNNFDKNGLLIEMIHSNTEGKLVQKTTFTYNNKGNIIETICRNADESLFYRTTDAYSKTGKVLEHFHYMSDDGKVLNRIIYRYDERDNMLSCIEYNGEGDIDHQTINKYNNKGQQVESLFEYADISKIPYNYKRIFKYNEHGDIIEMSDYKADGSLKNSSTYSYEYDIDGQKIIPETNAYSPDGKTSRESEEVENDHNGNWIKKTIFYNKVAINIYEREITYYDKSGSEKQQLVHLLTYITETEATKENYTQELTTEQAQWLVEEGSPDNFPILRYYALNYNESPSVLSYSGANVESLVLLKELKENMMARVIFTYRNRWNMQDAQLSHYVLDFPNYGYLLEASGLSTKDVDEYEIPDNIRDLADSYYDEGWVYTSNFKLYHPSDASGKRDEYFENDLNEYIDRCSFFQKPDKPTINIVEVSGNSFAMIEHPVNDDFVIDDLDLNYGEGFNAFHNELMNRFNTQTKGLVLFHGEPGTGKTYYIRHLLRRMTSSKKVVVYMPPNMVEYLSEPNFMTFLQGEVADWSADGFFSVLLIEDAEPLLSLRQHGARVQGITNLLNMSDGLLNDMLNMQIICTFNVELEKLDNALLRPGRLIARKEFKRLPEFEANLLAQRLGIKHHFEGPATLSEIYSKAKNKDILIHNVDEHDA